MAGLAKTATAVVLSAALLGACKMGAAARPVRSGSTGEPSCRDCRAAGVSESALGGGGPVVQVGPEDIHSKADLAALLQAHPSGTHFLFAPGVYPMGGGGPVALTLAQSGMVLDALDPDDPKHWPVFKGNDHMKINDGSAFLGLSAGIRLNGFTIRHLKIENFDLALVFAGSSEDVTIEDSELENFGVKGIMLLNCQRCSVVHNTLHSDQPQDHNDADAIFAYGVDLLLVKNNTVSSRPVGLGVLEATRTLVVGNTFIRREQGPGHQIGVVFGVDLNTYDDPSSDTPSSCDTSGRTGFVGAFVDNTIEVPTEEEEKDLREGWTCLAMVGPKRMQLLAVGNTCKNFRGSYSMAEANHVLSAGNYSEQAAAADDWFGVGDGKEELNPTHCGPSFDNIALVSPDDVVGGAPDANGNLLLRDDDLGSQAGKVEGLLKSIQATAEGPYGGPTTLAALHDRYKDLGQTLCDAARAGGGDLPAACESFL